MAPRSLVIGIGNPLRGDDGVGWQLAEELGDPHRSVHQLTPECAALLLGCDRVLFVDASWPAEGDPGSSGPMQAAPAPSLRRWPLGPSGLGAAPAAARAAGLSHHLSAEALLAIAAELYDQRPEAWQLLLPAADFAHAEGLSPSLRALLPEARRLLQRWLTTETG
jgi:hydrogenase maturation protease